MNHFRTTSAFLHIGTVGICLALFASSAWAAEEKAPWNVTYGLEYSDEAENNAKFQEYRYKRDEKQGFVLNLNRQLDGLTAGTGGRYGRYNPFAVPEGGARYLDISLKGRSPEDIDFSAGSGSYGVYKLGFDIRRMGHNFAYDARTPYSGNGGGTLTLDDALQTNIQTAASDTARATVLNNYMNTSGSSIDLSLKRDRVRANYQRLLTRWPATFNLFMEHELREGSRPYGGSFGHSLPVEIPEPIDYRTTDIGADVEYAAEDASAYANLSVKRSLFHNENSSVRFDNTRYVTDSTAGVAVGRMALPPDNTADLISLLLTQKLPHHSRVTTRAAFTRMRQNENLLPMSNNTAYDTAAPSYTKLGTTKARNKVDKKYYEVAISSPITEDMHFGASFRYDQHENKSPLYSTPIFLAYDGSVSKAGETTTYVSFVKRVAEAEIEYQVDPHTAVGFTYENENVSFRNGSARAEVENVYKLTIHKHKETLMTRLILERAEKKSAYPDYVKFQVETPKMRKFYAASRDRNRLTALVTYLPADRLALNTHYIFSKDDYPKSAYGMQRDKHHTISLDLEYELNDKTNFSTYYTYELYKTTQRSHQWAANAPTDALAYPDTYSQASSWTLHRKNRWHTFGGDVRMNLVENVLDASVSASHARIDGLADFESPVGAAAALDLNRFDPQDFLENDETRKSQAEARLDFRLPKHPVQLTLGYLFEKWEISDWEYDGLKEVITANDGRYLGLALNSLYKNYGNVHTFYFRTQYQF